MTLELQTKSAPISPIESEIMEAIIKATCEYYGITAGVIKPENRGNNATAIRRQCLYLIKQNTNISNESISQRLDMSRSAVSRSIDIIRVHKNIYAQTRHALKAIAAIANNFEKSCQWHIQ